MKKRFINILKILLFYAAIPFVASLPIMLVTGFGISNILVSIIGVPAIMLIIYILLKKFSKLDKKDYNLGMKVNGFTLLLLAIIFTIMMFVSKGNTSSELMVNFFWIAMPFVPSSLTLFLMNNFEAMYLTPFAGYITGFIFCAVVSKAFKPKKIIAPLLCIALCVGSCTYLYTNRPSTKYSGHGFDYMNGYSSTDFTDYTVYAKNSKLVTLDHNPSFTIDDENDMPVLDGAEACYPLYAAFAKAVYKDIDKIEKKYINNADYAQENGKIVTFTNTLTGFDRLIIKDAFNNVDMFFGAKPSTDQIYYAKECGVELEITPIGKEAFVFFVEENNPINSLTSEQIKQIYHGNYTNWSEVGGSNQKIKAFQRPSNSGSQTMMEYFMGNISLKEPEKYETISAMEGVIKEVAQYNNEEGAIGYTFRYFLEGLNQEKGVKMLKIDDVYPTLESIEDGSYPLTVDLCLVTRKGESNPNVQKMKEFILSEDGQNIIHKTGYGKLGA